MLFSVHLKATMMKVSDPIIFGHVVRAFFPRSSRSTATTLAAAGLSPNDGLGGILAGLDALPEGAEIKAAIRGRAGRRARRWPWSTPTAGITNLHVPSDVIVDASMPAMIRTSGHMWGPDGKEADTLAVIPDSSYAGIYQVVIDDCRANGAFDPATMGSVPNVGLMAQAAEEYGSHDKTFEIPAAGTVRVVDEAGTAVLEQAVERRRHLADVPDQGRRRSATGSSSPSPAPAPPATRPCSGWTRPRAHDANLIAKVGRYLPEHDTDGLTDRDHVAGRARSRSPWSASAAARTPSRSPATCCATT